MTIEQRTHINFVRTMAFNYLKDTVEPFYNKVGVSIWSLSAGEITTVHNLTLAFNEFQKYCNLLLNGQVLFVGNELPVKMKRINTMIKSFNFIKAKHDF